MYYHSGLAVSPELIIIEILCRRIVDPAQADVILAGTADLTAHPKPVESLHTLYTSDLYYYVYYW